MLRDLQRGCKPAPEYDRLDVVPLHHTGCMIRYSGFPLKQTSPKIPGWICVRQVLKARLCGTSLLTGDGPTRESIDWGTIPLGELCGLKGIMS